MHCTRSLHCCANKTLIMMIRLTCTWPEDESLGFSWERKVCVCQLPARSKDCWGSFQRLQGRECSSGLMAIKAEDGCACPLICWTHCSLYPHFILLLCCVLCKRNWKNQVWLRALWGSKPLRRREIKKGWDSSFCCSAVKDSTDCSWPPSTPYVTGQDLEEDGCWNTCGSLWLGLYVGCGDCTVPCQPCCCLHWELALGTTAQPETQCWEATALGCWLSAEGFLLRFEITYSPHRAPSLQLPSNESVSHLKCFFHNYSEVLEEGKLTVLSSSSVLSSLWPLLVFFKWWWWLLLKRSCVILELF